MSDPEGFAWSFTALGYSMNSLQDPTHGHPHARVGAALLWINVVNDVFDEAVPHDVYRRGRARDARGRAIPGLRTAFNALKHGSALTVEIRDESGIPGVRVGPRVWVEWNRVRDVLDKTPPPEEEESYRAHVEGREFEIPLFAARDWLHHAEKTWEAEVLKYLKLTDLDRGAGSDQLSGSNLPETPPGRSIP